ncbi:MAG TPA: saccharopine dehydrogenase NADP-binding domain-containing protein [Trueperaceae bacterium]|nr:saccharopine dehydrogenase NADP-binding domain-containing protein [Trueperaceae bacterium]
MSPRQAVAADTTSASREDGSGRDAERPTAGRLLIYGANGFVGQEASRAARARVWEPVLAGRNADEVVKLAREQDLEARVFSLEDGPSVREGLSGVTVVLNMAGPFQHTYRPLVEACLDVGAHYVDITGEMDVLIGIEDYDADARERGVMLLPAAGLDSVPADCLAAYLHRRLPTATRLRLAVQTTGPAGLPPGTLKTMISLAHLPDRVIENGEPVEASGSAAGTVDFGEGPVATVRYQAADTLVASRTTGIGDVEAYVALPLLTRAAYLGARTLRTLLRPPFVRSILGRLASGGSTEEQRRQSRTVVWAEAKDDAGGRAAARLHGPEGAVVWTVSMALDVVGRALSGRAVPGLQTPAGAFGPDLALETPGVTREDA